MMIIDKIPIILFQKGPANKTQKKERERERNREKTNIWPNFF